MESRFAFTCRSKWNHGNGQSLTWLVSVVIVLSMALVGPLLVSAPVGGGEVHAAGPGAPTCVDREVFSSNEVFSITTSRGISITTSFSLLSFFALLSSPSRKGFQKKRKSEVVVKTVTRSISDSWSPEGGHNDVSEYESLINISLNAVFP